MIHNSRFFDNIGQVFEKYPDKNYADLFSKGQVRSKRWLVEELRKLDKDLGTVFICAGWYGTLAAFMLESDLKIDKIRSFDIDETCASIADNINRPWVIDGWQFKASTLDITDMEYPTTHTTYRANGTSLTLEEMPDTIINTSCEHITDFDKWYDKIPQGKLVILQNNDYHDLPEHVNTVNSLDEFIASAPMARVLYKGELSLEKYTRYMIIGYK